MTFLYLLKMKARRLVLLSLCRATEWFFSSRPAPWNPGRLRELEDVVVYRLDAIGDNVMNTAFLRELRRNLPAARLTLVVNAAVYNLMEECPYVNQVLCYQAPAYRQGWHVFLELFCAVKFSKKHFWRDPPDAVLSPRWDFYSPAMIYLMIASRAKYRVGTADDCSPGKSRMNRGCNRFLSYAFYEEGVRHEVARNLDFLRALGGTVSCEDLELWLRPEEQEWADNFIAGVGLPKGTKLIAICLGASVPQKQWPLDSFVTVCRKLAEKYPVSFLVVGGPPEKRIAETFADNFKGRCLQAAGQTTLRKTTCLLRHAVLYLGNDTGPMHLAAAVGCNVVAISAHQRHRGEDGISSPKRFGPWGVKSIVLNSQNEDEMHSAPISAVTVEDVYAAVEEML